MKALFSKQTIIVICMMLLLLISMSHADEADSVFVENQDSVSAKTSKSSVSTWENYPKIGYIHLSLGAGAELYFSKDIDDMFIEDYKVQNIGAGFPLHFNIGLKQIMQISIGRFKVSGHALQIREFIDGQFVTTNEIKMKYKQTENILKINPFFWKNKSKTVSFIMIGMSSVEYLDDAKDGWKGDGTILGLEIGKVSKNVTFTFAFLNNNIKYDKFIQDGTEYPADIKAGFWQIKMSVSAGVGY